MQAKEEAQPKSCVPWYENLFWGPLAIALVGAFIALCGQLTSTVAPIYFGPASLCDYSISAKDVSKNIDIDESIENITLNENFTIYDLNPNMKPYKHPVYFKVISPPITGVTVLLSDVKGGTLPLKINMNLIIDNKNCIPGEYEIILQGKGEDGLIRNCSYFLNLKNNKNTIKKGYRTYRQMEWCCQNPQCMSLNMIESMQLEESIKRNLRPLLVCSNCGIVSIPENSTVTEKLKCSLYNKDVFDNLPRGRNDSGLFLDAKGESLSIDDYIVKYGVNPRLYLKYIEAGKPEPKQKCT